MAAHSSILAGKIPWTEKFGRLQSMGSQRVGYNWATKNTHTHTFMDRNNWSSLGMSYPLQCSCLENPRDSGDWWAAVYGVARSRTRLKRLSINSSSRNELLSFPASRTGKSPLFSIRERLPGHWCMFCDHQASLHQVSLLVTKCLANVWLRLWWKSESIAGPIVEAPVDFPLGLGGWGLLPDVLDLLPQASKAEVEWTTFLPPVP